MADSVFPEDVSSGARSKNDNASRGIARDPVHHIPRGRGL